MSTTTDKPSSSNDDITQTVPEGHQLIREGQITMLYPKSENSVFYNPVQVQNRDLSVLTIGMYAERRMERMWVVKKRKEVRKEMMQNQEEEGEKKKKEGGGDKKKKETKEERKAKIAQFEKDLEALEKDLEAQVLKEGQRDGFGDDGHGIER